MNTSSSLPVCVRSHKSGGGDFTRMVASTSSTAITVLCIKAFQELYYALHL